MFFLLWYNEKSREVFMNFEFLFHLSICFLLSFLIGFERQYRKRIIGLRTTILVSLGAFLFVTFSFSVGSTDISRIASQVVTGIGFLGAGVILKDGKKIRGLTTAATLWCDAAIGVLCAGGAILEASFGTFLILFANIVLRYINKLINNLSDSKNSKINYQLKIIGSSKVIQTIKKEVDDFLIRENVEINHKTIENNIKETVFLLNFLLTKEDIEKLGKLIDKIAIDYNIRNIDLKKLNEIKPEDFDDEL